MWLLFARASPPDAPYWRARRLLAGIDAVGWPIAWIAFAAQLPRASGIVGPTVVAIALVCALGRLHRALWLNHRYHFTTWRWARVVGVLLAIGAGLKLASWIPVS